MNKEEPEFNKVKSYSDVESFFNLRKNADKGLKFWVNPDGIYFYEL